MMKSAEARGWHRIKAGLLMKTLMGFEYKGGGGGTV